MQVMCGIVGYVGQQPAKPYLLDGLKRLEYRGYDSAGIALHSHSDFIVKRNALASPTLAGPLTVPRQKTMLTLIALVISFWFTMGLSKIIPKSKAFSWLQGLSFLPKPTPRYLLS
jgi:hypothetical protein